MNAHDRGDVVRITGTFTDITGALGDPGTVSLQYRKPSGLVTTLTYPTNITRASLGVFYTDLEIGSSDPAGVWNYEWRNTGALQATEPGQFLIRSSRLTGGDP